MNEPLDELYFEWLYSQALSLRLRNPKKTYWNLFRILYQKEFIWFIPNDDNRIEDGRDLRREFIDDCDIQDADEDWIHMGCSMLELLLGLSRRLAFLDEGEPGEWFWHMLFNIKLHNLNDAVEIDEDEVQDILDCVIWRTYQYEGVGGLFPLEEPAEDQREVELWYQLNAYILEQN